MIEAWLFDLDGTLVDTAPDLAAAANALRVAQGLAPLPLDHYRAHASSGARGLIGRALGVGSVKFSGQILPTAKKVTYKLDVKRVISRKLILGIADATVSVDGKEIYLAEDLRVGLFTSTDGF